MNQHRRFRSIQFAKRDSFGAPIRTRSFISQHRRLVSLLVVTIALAAYGDFFSNGGTSLAVRARSSI
jgi:hypothetical protein